MRYRLISSMIVCCSLGGISLVWSADSANDIFNTKIKQQYGTNEGLNKTSFAPITTGSDLQTLDGDKTFTANSFQTSGKPLLSITVTPNAPTGDLSGITIREDLNADGVYEINTNITSSTPGKMITGICSDGVIACTPGTGDNCVPLKWATDSNGVINVEVISSVEELTSCYCFSNYCSKFNNTSILNMGNIVSDVGGGIITSFIGKRNDYTISSAAAPNAGTIAYYGTKIASMPNSQHTVASPTKIIAYSGQSPDVIQGYYPDASAVSTVASSEVASQSANPDSLYNLVKSVADKQPGKKIHDCEIKRDISFTTNTKVYTTGVLAGDGYSEHVVCFGYFKLTDRKYRVILALDDVNQVHQPSQCQDVINSVAAGTTAIARVHYIELGVFEFYPNDPNYANGYSLSRVDFYFTASGAGCDSIQSSTSWFPGVSVDLPFGTGTSCPGSSVQHPSVKTHAVFTFSEQDFAENIIDNCTTYDADSNCTIESESWDGRDVIFNYIPTGYSLSDTCKSFAGPISTTKFCRPWMVKNRRYSCKDKSSPYVFDETRFADARTTADYDTTSSVMTYSDGGKTSSYKINPKPLDSPCEKVCKTKLAVPDVVVSSSGATTGSYTAPAAAAVGFRYFYRSCDDSDVCMVIEPNEEIVDPCHCDGQNDMVQVFAGFEAIATMKKDSICSSSPAP